jgi:hypothetical protein
LTVFFSLLSVGIVSGGAFFLKEYSATPSRNDPPLPGDTGWIFAGYYWLNEKKWAEGPWVPLPEKQASATLPIEIGDQVEVSKTELRYIIVSNQGSIYRMIRRRGLIPTSPYQSLAIPCRTTGMPSI